MKKNAFLLFLLFSLSINAQTKDDVYYAIQKIKVLIAQNDYNKAHEWLMDLKALCVMEDTITYYLKYIDFQSELDRVECLYKEKEYGQVVNHYDTLLLKYHDINYPVPQWVERSATIVKAQKEGHAVTKNMLPKLWPIVPVQSFKDGKALARHLFEKQYYFVIYKNNIFSIIDMKGSCMGGWFSGMALTNNGIVDKNHKQIVYINDSLQRVNFDYNEGRNFSEGLAAVRKGNKWGYIDKNGKEVIPCQYEDAWDFSEGLAMVQTRKLKKEGQEGNFRNCLKYINKHGDIIINSIAESVLVGQFLYGAFRINNYSHPFFSEGIANDPNIAYDKKGNILFFIRKMGNYNITGRYSCGMALAQRSDSPYVYGYIDKYGKPVMSFQWSDAYDFSENYAWVAGVSQNDNTKLCYGCIDKEGKTVIPFLYERGYTEGKKYEQHGGYVFSEGLAGVKRDGVWGFVNYKGEIIIPFEYEEVYDFSEGFAWVKKNGKWGIVDKFGTSTFDYE